MQLTIGQELYNLTQRDRETLLLDQIFRSYGFDIAAGLNTASLSVGIPVDRAVYIDRVIFLGGGWVGAGSWAQWLMAMGDAGGQNTIVAIRGEGGATARPLVSDGTAFTAPAAGEGCYQTVDVKTVFPPGFVNFLFQATTLAKAAGQVAITAWRVHGYFIPPGGIARR